MAYEEKDEKEAGGVHFHRTPNAARRILSPDEPLPEPNVGRSEVELESHKDHTPPQPPEHSRWAKGLALGLATAAPMVFVAPAAATTSQSQPAGQTSSEPVHGIGDLHAFTGREFTWARQGSSVAPQFHLDRVDGLVHALSHEFPAESTPEKHAELRHGLQEAQQEAENFARDTVVDWLKDQAKRPIDWALLSAAVKLVRTGRNRGHKGLERTGIILEKLAHAEHPDTAAIARETVSTPELVDAIRNIL